MTNQICNSDGDNMLSETTNLTRVDSKGLWQGKQLRMVEGDRYGWSCEWYGKGHRDCGVKIYDSEGNLVTDSSGEFCKDEKGRRYDEVMGLIIKGNSIEPVIVIMRDKD